MESRFAVSIPIPEAMIVVGYGEKMIKLKFLFDHTVRTDLYEMRVSVGSNEYRTVLFAIDNSNVILSTKIILLNGFLKKSTKDYSKQIAKAERILKCLAL